jgi:hypothetical protein
LMAFSALLSKTSSGSRSGCALERGWIYRSFCRDCSHILVPNVMGRCCIFGLFYSWLCHLYSILFRQI